MCTMLLLFVEHRHGYMTEICGTGESTAMSLHLGHNPFLTIREGLGLVHSYFFLQYILGVGPRGVSAVCTTSSPSFVVSCWCCGITSKLSCEGEATPVRCNIYIWLRDSHWGVQRYSPGRSNFTPLECFDIAKRKEEGWRWRQRLVNTAQQRVNFWNWVHINAFPVLDAI